MTVTLADPEPQCKAAVEGPEAQKVRALLPEAQQKQCDTATIERFLRAEAGNVEHAARRLTVTMAWRAKHQPDQLHCTKCTDNPGSHYLHLVGFCKARRPTMYSCNAMSPEKSYEHNRDHMLQTFEMAVRCMDPAVEQWIWVCDFHGFGMADINMRLARAFLSITAEHYPERLGMFMVIDAPSAFNIVWKAVQSFVDPKTHQKIRFLPYDAKAGSKGSKLVEGLEQVFDKDMVAWLVREMGENRARGAAARKTYDLAQVKRDAAAGELVPQEAEEGSGAECCAHDLRGTQSLLKLLQQRPGVMDAQPA